MSKILLFSAPWCSACKSLKLELERVSSGPLYEEVDADTEEGSALVKTYGIRGLPTLIKLDDSGEVKEALTGYKYSREVFNKFFEV